MRKILVLFVVLPGFLSAQNTSSKQLKYLYDAGRLWGNVKYFHPYLQYKPINWDSSFIAAVPQVLNCRSAKEYATVLQNMLSVLNDDATYASIKNNRDTSMHFTNTEKGKVYIQDSILIMRLNDKAVADDYNETVEVTSKASNLLDSVKAAVFDLRQTEGDNRLADLDEMNFEFLTGTYAYQGLTKMLCAPAQPLPAERFVTHQGFKPEGTGGADYAYQPFFKMSYSNIVNGVRKKPLKIVFLLNKNVAVPGVALALQKKGSAIILSQDEHIESCAVSSINYTIDSVEINLRKSELVDEDGLLKVYEDSLLTPQTDYNINLQKAIAIAAGPFDHSKRNNSSKIKYTGEWKADTYNTNRYPDLGNRVLAAAKMYSVIHFFNPDKDLFDNNWDSVFLKYLPQFVTAKDSVEYMRAVAGMYSNMQDSHGFAMSAVRYAWDTLFGTGSPASIRVTRVENKSVVSLIVNDSTAKKEGFELGDVVLSVNGRSPDDIIKEAGQYFPTSNRETKYRDINNMLLRGDDSTTADVLIQKPDGKQKHITALRSTKFYGQHGYAPFYRNKLPVCKILQDNIGYIDMVQLRFNNVDSVMNMLRNTKAIIFDDRSYPPDAAQQLFNYLPLPASIKDSLSGPVVDADVILNEYRDYSYETVRSYKRIPSKKGHKWTYNGKLVVLFNEWTQSQAEGTASSLIDRGAIGIGTHTAGANGDITNFNLPGNVTLAFSGHRASMQRTGIIPHIKAEPTIKGVRAGKDEVLERAVSYLQKGK